MDSKLYPLIPDTSAPGPCSIPWSIAEKAYGAYRQKFGSSQSLERLAKRGGFYWGEMDELYPQWRKETDEIIALRSEVESLRQGNKLLEDNIAEKRNECMNLRQQLTKRDEIIRALNKMVDSVTKREGFVELEDKIVEQAKELEQKDEVICGMREAILAAIELHGDQIGRMVECEPCRILGQALPFPAPPCPHKEEVERLKTDYTGACQTIAEMHAAAVGEITGPKRGVVEDVIDLRQQLAIHEERERAVGRVLDMYTADIERRDQQLTAAQETICGMREALKALPKVPKGLNIRCCEDGVGMGIFIGEKGLRERLAQMREALEQILAVSRDREAFVMQGPRAFAKAEQIASKALAGKE